MTEQFEEVRKKMKDIDDADIVLVCVYQLATTMMEIEKDMKRIETELRGIRGRIWKTDE